MGRTETSQGLAPPAIRKNARTKQARHIINKTIPAILLSNSRAKQGVESSLLIVNPCIQPPTNVQPDDTGNEREPKYVQRKGQGRRKIKHSTPGFAESNIHGLDQSKKRHISHDGAGSSVGLPPSLNPPKESSVRIMWTDSLTAAAALTKSSTKITKKKQPNVCILNMASPLRPGGGVLNGATSQEEFLCARTTLLPSLKESFYRLPEVGGVFTHDVLVFRNSRPLHDSLGGISVAERFWVDVISAAMLRFPHLQGEEGENKRWSTEDRIVAEAKMRAVLRIASHHGIKKLVLGAWGCGAYGNPVYDVAEAWKKVLTRHQNNHKKEEEDVWVSIEEVVFAISNRTMADEFASVFDKLVEVESDSDVNDGEEHEHKDEIAEELQDKIRQLQDQLSGTQNAGLKSRLGLVLDDLKMQLRHRGKETEETNDVRNHSRDEVS
ncbi:MAG: hypothetical protein GOMPHAMPRED_005241 [Gomphillus americanus]|uniref:Microbial-type PARG catalytic domain-containing protein n=1 Tax=Gomphillus americanus TaxID=1940652 RepID=A0A8H3FQP1_9LECA|nr:MAG: hypothetical protein GOMPHAMPRED_005241 [Gomphillus americanus]